MRLPQGTMSAALAAREVTEADLLEAIRDVSQAVIARLMPQVFAEGLNGPTFWHLHYLERSGAKHPGELARRLGITPATCTWSVDQLVEHGFVVRRPSENDRRQVVLVITPKGRRTLEAIWRRFDASLAGPLRSLSPRDVSVTARTLQVLTERLRKEPLSPVREGGS